MAGISLKNKKEGHVYTKSWVVDAMLDLVGYTTDRDLHNMVIIEPSCGDGAFLERIAYRLAQSARSRNVQNEDLFDAVAAYDLDEEALMVAGNKCKEILSSAGFDGERIVAFWLRKEDFILADKPMADVVIGNPPYVKAGNIGREKRGEYIALSKTMTMGTDLYVGFLEHGLGSLKNGGKLCYICADRWMQNGYGKKIRRFVNKGYSLDCVIKMNGVDCFESSVSAYPAITIISAKEQGKGIFYADCSESFNQEDVPGLLSHVNESKTEKAQRFTTSLLDKGGVFSEKSWVLGNEDTLSVIASIEDRTLDYAEAGISIGIGIATGAQSIYVVKENPGIEPSRLLPTVLREDISHGRVPETPVHWIVNPWDEKGNLVSLETYPKLRRYFETHYDELSKRHVAKSHSDDWYRTIDRLKCGLLDKPKLMIGDLLARAEPILDDGTYYPSHAFYYLTSDKWDLLVLGGLLLSDLTNIFVSSKGVKMRGKTLRFQAQYLKMLHFPNYDFISQDAKDILSRAFISRDRELANQGAALAYGLNEIEKGVLKYG